MGAARHTRFSKPIEINQVMKKIIVISLIGGGVTAGIFYVINRLQKKNIQIIRLDFAEYALGGY